MTSVSIILFHIDQKRETSLILHMFMQVNIPTKSFKLPLLSDITATANIQVSHNCQIDNTIQAVRILLFNKQVLPTVHMIYADISLVMFLYNVIFPRYLNIICQPTSVLIRSLFILMRYRNDYKLKLRSINDICRVSQLI